MWSYKSQREHAKTSKSKSNIRSKGRVEQAKARKSKKGQGRVRKGKTGDL
jgi:hypothetical protein